MTDSEEAARSFLRFANRAKVAAALTAGGYPVTRVTVGRWAHGAPIPPLVADAILDLIDPSGERLRADQLERITARAMEAARRAAREAIADELERRRE